MNGSMIQFLTGVQATCADLRLASAEAMPAELVTALQNETMMRGAIGTLREVQSLATRTASGISLTDAQVFLRLLNGHGVTLPERIAEIKRAHEADTSAVPSAQVFGEIASLISENVALFPSETLSLRHGQKVVVRLSMDVEAEAHYNVVSGKLELSLTQRAKGAAYPKTERFQPPAVHINDEPQTLKSGRGPGYDGRPPYYYFRKEIPLENLPPHTVVSFHHLGVTKIINVDVQRASETDNQRRAPLHDLFDDHKVLDLERYRDKVKKAAAEAKGFRDRIEAIGKIVNDEDPKAARADRLVAYRAIEDEIGLDKLCTADTTQLFYAYKKDGQWADVARLYETSPNQPFRDSQLIKEFYIVSLNKLGWVMESIKTSRAYINQGHNNGEVWAGMGKAHRLRSETAYALFQEMERSEGQRDNAKLAALRGKYQEYFGGVDPDDAETDGMQALTESYQCYLRGYLIDLEYYPGVNAVYNLLQLGQAKKAKNLARMVYFSTMQSGGKQSSDYWCLATMLELAMIQENEAEIDDMLPRVLARVRSADEADSTLPQMRKLVRMRQEAEQDTTKLEFVIAQLEARKEHPGLPVSQTNPDVSPIREEAPASSRSKQVTDTLLAKSFHYQGLNSSFISGNARFGGQLHDHVVNRADLKLARDLLTSLNLTAETNFEVFNDRVDQAIAQMLDFTDPATGERVLEKYHGDHHKLFDKFMQGLLDYSGSRKFGDSRTNIFVDLAIGRGDCRQAAYTKQLLFDIWRQDRITSMMRTAYDLLMKNKEKDYQAQLAAIEDLVRTQLVVMDVKIGGKIQRDDMGRPLMEGDRYKLADEEPERPEEHTLNALIRFDETGSVAFLRLKDSFYHEVYPWGELEVNPADILKEEGMAAGTVLGVDQEGCEVQIPVFLTPTAYAGSRDNLNPDEFGQTRLRGLEVAPPTVENLFRKREKAQALVQQVLGIDESGWDVLRSVLAREVDSVAAPAHDDGWLVDKRRDRDNPDNPFVGWGPKRVKVSAETKAMSREALSAFVGAEISEQKYAAIQASPDGMDITHHWFRPYAEVVTSQPDGGTRFVGQNALALLTLGAYLADFHGDEAGTKVRIAQILKGLEEGSDASGIEQLTLLQTLAFKAAQLVNGERGIDTEVLEMVPTGKKITLKARKDLAPYRDLRKEIQALDQSDMAPAVKWFGRRLGIGQVAA